MRAPLSVTLALGVIVGSVVVASGHGCALTPTGSLSPTPSASASSGFSAVQSILAAKCVTCHASVKDHSAFGTYTESQWAQTKTGSSYYVVPASPSTSLLYTKLAGAGSGGNMPLGGQLTAAEIETIRAWIAGLSTSLAPSTNTAPTVSAGSSQTIVLSQSVNLAATATDDGKPNATMTYAWTKSSGPGTVTFTASTSKSTAASFSATGTYVLQFAASDGALTSTSTVTITVNADPPGNTAPTANSGSNQSITLPTNTVTLSGTSSDDGNPAPPGAVTVSWSKVSGPGNVTFASSNALTTAASFSWYGTYVLRLTANDSALTNTSDVTITVNASAAQASRLTAAQAVWNTNCAACHSWHTKDELSFETDGLVVRGDPNNSKIYYRLQGSAGANGTKDMPQGQAALSAPNMTTIQTWVQNFGVP